MKVIKKLFIVLIPFLLFSCLKDDSVDYAAQEERYMQDFLEANSITTAPTESGLYYIENVAGTGDFPQVGDSVSVHYTGYLIDGTAFDSSIDGEPFKFVLGKGKVIQGWDEGIAYMQEGTEATLIIPSWLGYGASGFLSIPPYSTLIFDVTLVSIID